MLKAAKAVMLNEDIQKHTQNSYSRCGDHCCRVLYTYGMQQLRHMKVKAYTVISIAITVGIAVAAFFCFPHAFGRLVESLRDLGMSFVCFFTYLFGHSDAVTPTVITYPDYTFLAYFGSGNAPNTALAETFEGFIDQWIIYWKTLISKANKINNI